MKRPTFVCVIFSLFACMVTVSHGATVFYSFDSLTNGTGTYTTNASVNSGFASASGVTTNGSVLLATGAGGATFTDFNGTTWTGSGGSSTPGHSMVWNGGSTGNSFSLTLDTTGLSALSLRLDTRSAGTSPPSAFSNFTYTIGAGSPVSISTLLGFGGVGGSYFAWSADLSGVTAINNQSSVTLTWTMPDVGSGASLRIDNLQISASAVPEPSVSTLLFVSLIGAGLYVLKVQRGNELD